MKFNKGLLCLSLLVFLGLAQLATQAQWQSQSQQQQSIRARISGGGGSGKCTFEVTIDGAADVEIQGDQGQLRGVGAGGVSWRRLDCNQALPRNPSNFQFRGIDGRGSQTLVRDPSSNNGVAVIRLDDPQGGSESYTGDITWSGGDTNLKGSNNGAYQSGLQVLRAEYGAGNQFSDVTTRLNSQIQNGQLNLQVNNNSMGGDPARSQNKTLRVQYAYNNQTGEMVINEGDYLRLPGDLGGSYNNGAYQSGLNQNPGYQSGYRDGGTDGRNDRSAGRALKYGPGYRHPDRGYQNSYGDKKAYEQQYRDGYQQGYQRAYNGRGYSDSTGSGSYGSVGWSGGYGQSQNPGYLAGYQDGSTDGRNDYAAGRASKYGLGYGHPDRGYQNSYGDKKAYEQQYRDGYQQGYQQAYNGQR